MEPPGCPFTTLNQGPALPEVRAYKLGKKRWSYNQVELRLTEAGRPADSAAQEGGVAASSGRRAVVQQAVHCAAKFPDTHQDSAVAFLVQLESGAKLQAHVYLCYDASASDTTGSGGGGDGSARGPALVPGTDQYSWSLVTRQNCCKGCDGRVLRSIQRFGRVGKRAGCGDARADTADSTAGPSPGPATGMKKDPRFMYLSLDEACTHVDASAFRLVAGIYNRQGTALLATAVSPPIRVLANNDVPTGAARITLEAQLPADWEGWAAEGDAPAAAAPAAKAATLLRPAKPAAAPRRRAAAKARQAAGGSSSSVAEPSFSSFDDTSDLSFGTPEVKDRLPGSHAAQARPPSARQRQRAAQRAAAVAAQRQQQQAPLGTGPFGGAQQPVWQLPLPALASPERRVGAAVPPAQLARTLSLPAAVAAYLADSAEGTGGGSGAAPRSAEEHGSGRRLRRRLSMPAGAQYKFSVEGLSELAVEPPELATAASFRQLEPPPQWLAPAAQACACGCAAAGAAAQQEAERQLRLLSQLKAQILAASNEAASSGGCAGCAGLTACPSSASLPAPSDSFLLPNDSLLAEDSGFMLDNLGLPLLNPTEDDDSALHLALMDQPPSGMEMLDISSLFDDVDTGMIHT